MLPPGYITNLTATGVETGPGWGWCSMLLPQIEQTAIWSGLNMSLPIEDPSNKTARQTTMPTLLCPANEISYPAWPAEVRDASGNPTSLICKVAFAPYMGMMGSTDINPVGDGLFFRNSRLRFADVIDGTSQTIAVGERAYLLGEGTWVGAVTGATLFPDPDEGEISLPNKKPSSGMILGYAGTNGPGSPQSEINQYYSLHGAGANFLFADGHVEFLPTSLDGAVYRRLGNARRRRTRQPPLSLAMGHISGRGEFFASLLQDFSRLATFVYGGARDPARRVSETGSAHRGAQARSRPSRGEPSSPGLRGQVGYAPVFEPWRRVCPMLERAMLIPLTLRRRRDGAGDPPCLTWNRSRPN